MGNEKFAKVFTVAFNVLAFLFLAALLYGLLSSPAWPGASLGIAITAAGLCALIGNLDKFESLKFGLGGVEARMRALIQKAQATIEDVQKVATMFGAIVIETDAASGRYGGGSSIREKAARKDQILASLSGLGVSDDAIQKVSAADRKWVIVDYVFWIFDQEHPLIKSARKEQKIWNAFANFQNLERPNADEIERFLMQFGSLDEEIREKIEDYRYYRAHNRHRRPEVWANRQK